MHQLWAHVGEGLLTLLPHFVLGTILLPMFYGEVRLRTGEVWPAILMHLVGNTLANGLLIGGAGDGFVSFAPGRAWLGSAGAEGTLMIASFALLGGALYMRRRGLHHTNSPIAAKQTA